ncbi:hypothetical protein ANO14919_057530 [Xylariales sp. No.14919]|nr:hypothetical protein ANO14919_057530 [Xylariales sp. No.14919]
MSTFVVKVWATVISTVVVEVGSSPEIEEGPKIVVHAGPLHPQAEYGVSPSRLSAVVLTPSPRLAKANNMTPKPSMFAFMCSKIQKLSKHEKKIVTDIHIWAAKMCV